MDRNPLFLVFDTNIFLAPAHCRLDNATSDSRTAIGILKDFSQGDFGTLPAAVAWIPWIVRSELVGISNRDLSKTWQPEKTVAGQAAAALDYLDYVTLEAETCVLYQNQMEHHEANLLRTQPDDKDELVLLSCYQAKALYSRNVWLVTNDVRLQARAMRSGIGSLSFFALKHTMTLSNSNGPEGCGGGWGCTFVENMPEPWRHLTNPAKFPKPVVPAATFPKPESSTVSTEKVANAAATHDSLVMATLAWIVEVVRRYCIAFLGI
ncbi:hypothetical protein BV898_01809 [Hypsibius exemplaris]|uniref:PIN domain-containing protein n=1 Tax=Hypsibius exemplaris TaxID=2072580 RepID=A0A1W0XA34_HYPEX|nr:hypothetical protein BV898_01809 [Hypsibius exemplaris]